MQFMADVGMNLNFQYYALRH